jgi:hypothetical protein
MQMRTFAPGILLLKRIDRIFPQQPNMAVVQRFADTLACLSTIGCQPHLPEMQALPLPGEEPEEIPLGDLPWAALKAAYATDGTRYQLPHQQTRRKAGVLHERYLPGTVLIVGTTSKPAEVPVPLRRSFTAELPVPALNEEQRAKAIGHTLGCGSGLSEESLRSTAQATAGFLPCDLAATACDAVLQVILKELATRQAQGQEAITVCPSPSGHSLASHRALSLFHLLQYAS